MDDVAAAEGDGPLSPSHPDYENYNKELKCAKETVWQCISDQVFKYLLYIYSIFTLCTLYVLYIYSIFKYVLYIYSIFTLYVLYIYSIYTLFTLFIL
jgi:hypothetical protein